MNFLGPIGLILTFVWVFERLLGRLQNSVLGVGGADKSVPTRFLDRLTRSIDYRLILAGVLIPDLIDKPLVFLIDPQFINGSLRSVGHSLIGGLVMLCIVWIGTRGWQRMPAASFGIALLAHLLFDRMWQMPEVLEWPARGSVLPMQNIPFSHWYRIHFTQLPTTMTDFIGIALLVLFTGSMIWNRSVFRFLKTGRLS